MRAGVAFGSRTTTRRSGGSLKEGGPCKDILGNQSPTDGKMTWTPSSRRFGWLPFFLLFPWCLLLQTNKKHCLAASGVALALAEQQSQAKPSHLFYFKKNSINQEQKKGEIDSSRATHHPPHSPSFPIPPFLPPTHTSKAVHPSTPPPGPLEPNEVVVVLKGVVPLVGEPRVPANERVDVGLDHAPGHLLSS